MSNTIKDRPEWVRRFDGSASTHVVHDHTDGRCKVETIDDAVYTATRRLRDHGRRACPARQWVEKDCGGITERVRHAPYCESSIAVICGWGRAWGCKDGVHTVLVATGEHCDACADADERDHTCYVAFDNIGRTDRFYGRPRRARDFTKVCIERPNRRRLRDDLRNAVRLSNSDYADAIDISAAYTKGADWLWW